MDRSEHPTAAARAAAAARDGMAWLSRQRFDEAERCFRQVAALRPGSPEAHATLGAILGALGRPAEAVASLRTAVRLRPDSADAHGNLGNALRDLGCLREAEQHLREALRIRPAYPEACNNLGAVLRDRGQVGEAEGCFRAALRLRPDFAQANRNLGLLLRALGRHGEAAASLRAALASLPEDGTLLAELGAALRSAGRPAEAVPFLTQALRRDPASEAAQVELGNTLHDLGRLADAEVVFRAALETHPGSSTALLGIGVVQSSLGRFRDGEAALLQVLRREPTLAEAHSALGDTLRNRGRLGESEAALREALRLRPDYPDAQVHLAFTLLQAGRFAEGWQAYEHRGRARAWHGRARTIPGQRWDGAPLAGRTLLLHAEQGLGDTLQFCRYVGQVEPGARVFLQVQAPLVRLLTGQFGTVEVLDEDDAPPRYDVQCPLLSLPHILGRQPAAVPYLSPDPARVARWRDWLDRLPGRRVGLVWAGSPDMAADRRRSLPLAALRPLGDVAGISFVSLQRGPAASEPPAGLTVHDRSRDLGDFTETAALVAALDLVVGVDTAVVHLAGALGKPVWLLNRADTCWRWLERPGTSPWYPTLREFRQPAPGDWDSVIAGAQQALAEIVGLADTRASAPTQGGLT